MMIPGPIDRRLRLLEAALDERPIVRRRVGEAAYRLNELLLDDDDDQPGAGGVVSDLGVVASLWATGTVPSARLTAARAAVARLRVQ